MRISNTRMNGRSARLMRRFAADCARCYANRKSDPALAGVMQTINAGRMHSSRKLGCSPCTRCGLTRDNPDEETTDWRAVCGKTARTVRREGRAGGSSLPLSAVLFKMPLSFCLSVAEGFYLTGFPLARE